MKYIKNYENIIEDEPKIGDYVICEILSELEILKLPEYMVDMVLYIHNNIGKITHCGHKLTIYKYGVYYDLPKRFMNLSPSDNIFYVSKDNIKYWSKNKSDLEPLLAGKKYNL